MNVQDIDSRVITMNGCGGVPLKMKVIACVILLSRSWICGWLGVGRDFPCSDECNNEETDAFDQFAEDMQWP